MSEKDTSFDLELKSKIDLLDLDHKQLLSRIIDLFFIENSDAIKNGFDKELAEKIVQEITFEKQWLTSAIKNPALKDIFDEPDIYTLNDGKPFNG